MSEATTRTDLPRVASVLDSFSPFEVVINRGQEDGIQEGQRYLVFGFGPEVTDPASGRSLGRVELVRGRGEVVHVQDHLAILRSTERRRAGVTRRRYRAGGNALTQAANWLNGELVEEDVPEATPVPFQGVVTGDLVKPI